MKFVSKNSNLNIILRSGRQAQPLTGSPAVPALFVRFRDGIANVEQQELIDMMVVHPGFNRDFVVVEDGHIDPYTYLRKDQEPSHVITELKYGHPVGKVGSQSKKELPVEIRKMIQDQAMEIAKQMLPHMIESIIKESSVKNGKTSSSNVSEERGSGEESVDVFTFKCDKCDYVATHKKEGMAKNALRLHQKKHIEG